MLGALVIIGEVVIAGGVETGGAGVIAGPVGAVIGGLGAEVIAGAVVMAPVEVMLGLFVTEGIVTASSSGDSDEQAQQRARTNQ